MKKEQEQKKRELLFRNAPRSEEESECTLARERAARAAQLRRRTRLNREEFEHC